jgi:hypothetical protein
MLLLCGACVTPEAKPRLAMNFDYIPRFLKAECHMSLENPPEIAQYYPGPLLELCGYRSRAEVEEAVQVRRQCDVAATAGGPKL